MAENERNDDWQKSVERINQARWERSDAAWRPFEEKWSALVAAKDDALSEARKNALAEGTPAEANTEADLGDLFPRMAAEAAETAHEKDFETRRGCRVLEDVLGGGDVCVVYNNNFYARVPTYRDRELEELRGWMEDQDANELAYAEYPDRGADEGYSYALLVWCESATVDDLREQYQAITFKSLRDMPWPGADGADPAEG